jgi:diguanylate cyclase (GGDEF)-like protein
MLVDDAARIAAVRALDSLHTEPEPFFENAVRLAAVICGTPISFITVLDGGEQQWFKSRVGLSVSETHRQRAFCALAINQTDLFIVEDATKDIRFKENPLVTGSPGIRFYASMPLRTLAGYSLGTLCVIDTIPRILTVEQQAALRLLSSQVENQIAMQNSLEQLQRANGQLQELTITDALTGLCNRRGFDKELQQGLEGATRYDLDFALLMIDVDHFKGFNDTFGHGEGDEVLKRVARLLMEGSRSTDIVCRYGGEEFGVLLPNTDLNAALLLGERLCRLIASTAWNRRPVTVSLGASANTGGLQDPAILVRRADLALYEAKTQGRNRALPYLPKLQVAPN